MATVARQADGRVDPDCPVVDACLEAFHDVIQHTGPALEGGIVELLPLLAEARWPELFIPLAWPDMELAPFAPFHLEAWKWWANIGDTAPPALVACWPRGSGKSSSVSMMLALSCLIGLRDYCLWVGAREGAIVDKVSGVGALLAAPRVRAAFPEQTAPYLDAMSGVKQDWRQGRIATASGFALDAVGMDQALRGALRLNSRPGLLVLDDVQSSSDSEYIVGRKIEQITRSILPAGAENCGTIFVMNRISDTSIMAGTLDGKLDFLRRRIVSGPWPQVRGIEVELEQTPEGPRYTIVAGEPTWEGAPLDVCEAQLNSEGLRSWLAERNHDSSALDGVLFPRNCWVRLAEAPSSGVTWCRSWDVAGSTNARADYTVGALVGRDEKNGRTYIADIIRGRWTPDEVDERIAVAADADAAMLGRCAILIERQPAAAGKAWAARWISDVLAGHRVTLVDPIGTKIQRADTLSSKALQGLVVLVTGEWDQAAFVDELAVFGTVYATHDDQVDAVSQGYNYLAGVTRRSKGSLATAARRQIG